jgi:hypothetical protein
MGATEPDDISYVAFGSNGSRGGTGEKGLG